MDEEFTLDEMIEYYKLVNEIYKILSKRLVLGWI